YMPVLKAIIDQCGTFINGMIHCTGGGQSKVLHFVDRVRVIKDNLLPIPPVFQLIEEESGLDRKEMYQVFNMGHRLEIYTDQPTAEQIIGISNSFGIEAQIVGHVEKAETASVEIRDDK